MSILKKMFGGNKKTNDSDVNHKIISDSQTGHQNQVDKRKTANMNFQLAQHYDSENDAVHARIYYLYGVKYIKELAESEKDIDDLALLYRCYALLGNSFMQEGDYAQGGQYWQNAFETEKLLIRVDPDNTGHYSSAGISSQWAGYCFKQCGQVNDAYACYRQSLEIMMNAEDERFPGRVFIYEKNEKRYFGSFRAEASIRLAEMSQNPEMTSAFCKECLETLAGIYNNEQSTDALYDVAYGFYLCSKVTKGDEQREYQQNVRDMCEIGMNHDGNRMKFAKLKNLL